MRFPISIERLTTYAEAGADCLYAPGVTDPREIEAIVKAVSPKPVNVLVGWPDPNLTVAKLTDLGVRRISVGSALARVAWGSFMRAAQSIATTGTFDSLGESAAFAQLNTIFERSGS
jgi:2-methylisocitrate lyase-like PEP mutase family enzyme